MSRKRKGRKPPRIYTIKDGTTLRFSGVSHKFGLPMPLPKGVKVKRVAVD